MSTTATTVLTDALTRVHDALPGVVEGLEADAVLWRPDAGANSIGWLVWHLTRVQDDHVAGVAGREQVWTSQDFAERFALPYDEDSIGYGQDEREVAAFDVADTALLLEYHAAVHAMSVEAMGSLGDDDLDQVIDEQWDPPVTVAVRLVSVVGDVTQHLGQAAYLRGLVERR